MSYKHTKLAYKTYTMKESDLHNDHVKKYIKSLSSKPLLILNKIFCRHLTEIKAVWLVKREAGKAVC